MSNEGLSIFYKIAQSLAKETKDKFKLRTNQFSVHAMGYSGSVSVPDIEGLKYLAKSQKYEFQSFGVLRIKISYHGFKGMIDKPFILTNRDRKTFLFMAESGPGIKMDPKKKDASVIGLSIARHLFMNLFDFFQLTGMRMHMCSTKVPLSSLHYYIIPLN